MSSAAVLAATAPGRRITARERRYQKPDCSCAASRRRAARQRRGLSAFTRGPSTASRAGSSVSATSAATSATSAPPMPMEKRKRWGNTSSEDSAAATVTAENSTVRPAVRIVATSARRVSCVRSSSSRKRETMNSE